MLEKPLYLRLTHDAAVSALVDDRVYEFEALDPVYPLIGYQIEDQTEDFIDQPAQTMTWMVTISSVSLSTATTRALADAVRAAISRATVAWETVTIQYCGFQSETTSDVSDPSTPGTVYYIKEQTYKIMGYPTPTT